MMSILFVILVAACKNTPVENREYGWFDFVIPDSDTLNNSVDMAFLNVGLAGASGFITVKDGHFVDGKGERIRFFGTNLTFSSCFPDKKTATLIAGRLRKLGMNVVRFHHMDNQSAPEGIWDKSMKDLDPVQLDKLDWLVYQLKIHGVYSNLNTHVSRSYPGLDYKNTEQFNYGKTIDQFYHPYIEMQKVYARKLLTHRNPYTGTTYDKEPAVAFVEVNNENSLLSNWSLLPQLNNTHKSDLIRQWKNWLASDPKYGKITGVRNDLMEIIQNYDKSTTIQKEMLWSFLMRTELAYAKEMTGYYKNDLKIHALIAETQASYSGVEGVYRESEYSDFVDMHAYWEHPHFPGQSWSSTDWLIRNSSMVTDKNGGTLLRFGQHRVAGMPLTISEYDHPAPSFYCAEMFPMLNSVAAFQDFDGIYHFTFDAPYDKGRIDNFFSSAGHPLKQIFVPIGAAIFRMGEVQPGRHSVQLDLPPDSVLGKLVRFGEALRLHGTNMNSVWEEAGAPNALIILHPMSVNMKAGELKLSEPVQKPAGPWESETGEIIWENGDSTHALFRISAPSAKAAIGYIGGKSIELGNVAIAMDRTPHNWATIALAALDGKPVERSSRVLLVAAGRVENSDWHWNKDTTSLGADWGKSPTRAEGIPARMIFRNMDKFSVHALDPSGNPGAEIPVNKRGGDQSFGIGAQYKTLWYIITRE
jgi:hypothetical protein